MKNFLTFLIALISVSTFANNINVSNITLTAKNTTNKTYTIGFDIAWDNSWRTSTNESNYDGAWIFVKFRKNGTGDWLHATLNTSGEVVASGATLSVVTDKKGAFIHRAADGIGNVSYTGNSFTWEYGTDGGLDSDTYEVKVFALEMINIPTGNYYLGDGVAGGGHFKTGGTTPITPYQVTSNGAITMGTAVGNLDPSDNITGSLSANYANAYDSYWVMKYEISQQQYLDMMNHIDFAKYNTLKITAWIPTGTHPALVAPAPERACGGIAPISIAALSDWSALRPMSDFEFEKACRGVNILPVPNEYVWGNTTLNNISNSASNITNIGLANESIASGVVGNNNIATSTLGALRVGIFARPTTTSRVDAGATYYGLLNMGDNMLEIAFSIYNATARNMNRAVHGDGKLSANGESDIAIWTTVASYMLKGGSYASTITGADLKVSDRTNRGYFGTYGNGQVAYFGGRMVRTAE